MIGEQICAHWVNKLSLWANWIPRLPSCPYLRSEREPGNEVGLWTSMDCRYNHNSLRGSSRKEEGRRRKGREMPFSLSLFFSPPPPPPPLFFMGLPHRIYGYILKKYLAAFPLTPGWVVSPSLGMNKMITYGKMRWSLSKFSRLILKEMYGKQFREFVCGSVGPKGLTSRSLEELLAVSAISG